MIDFAKMYCAQNFWWKMKKLQFWVRSESVGWYVFIGINILGNIICYYLQITRQPSEFCVLLRVWKALFCTKSFFHKNQGNQFWSCILLRVTQWHINFGNPLSPKMTRGRWPECEPLQRKDHQHHLRLTTGIIRRSRNGKVVEIKDLLRRRS